MIILHGGWQDGWMLLWAERSPDELRPKGNGDPAANEHPYCADHGELVSVLTSAAPGFRADSGEAVSATAWLPGRGGSPLPSSALVADPPRSRAKPRLLPWSIPAYRVSPADAVPIFQACKGREMLTTGVRHRRGLGLLEPGDALHGGAGGSATVSAGGHPRRRWRSRCLGAAVHRSRRRTAGPAEPAYAGVGPGAVGPRRRPTARPAGGHRPQNLRRRGRGQPGQKSHRRIGGNYTQGPSQKVSFRQRTRRLAEWPEVGRRSSSRYSGAIGAVADSGNGVAEAHFRHGQRAVSSLLSARRTAGVGRR